MKKTLSAVICLLLLGCASKPYKDSKAWDTACGNIPDLEDVVYCVSKIGDNPSKILVFNHGLGDSEKVFLGSSLPLKTSYPDLVAAMPSSTVVTISWGPGWLLTDYPNRVKKPVTAVLDVYKNKVLPYIEGKFGLKGPYVLFGHSQGGFNTAQLCAKYPEMWSRCALINPMLLQDKVDPWNLAQICPGCLLVKPNYDNKAQWLAYRPTATLKASTKLPPIYVTACKTDLFKLHPGAVEWVLQARAKGNSVKLVEGGDGCDHTHFNVKSLITFLFE